MRSNLRRFLSFILCAAMLLTNISIPAFAEETEAPSCTHSNTKTLEEAGTAATCTAEGSHTVIKVCADCGEELSRKTVTDAVLGHDYSSTSEAPTCTEAGKVVYTCSRCGKSYSEEGKAALGHDYKETARTKPSCGKAGSVTYTCSRCGKSYSEEIPELSHDYEKSVTAPTCTEAGKVTYTCTHCGDTYTEAGEDALGHDYKETDRTEASCGKAGSVTYTCSRCEKSYSEEIPALKHDYKKTEADPTCTEAGKVTFTCSLCGDTYTEAGKDALGHDYKETDRTEATYDAAGSVTYTCTRCGDSYKETLPQLERPAEPFEQTETVDGVKITVTAAAGVFDAGAKLNIGKTGNSDFTDAAEVALGIEAGDRIIIRHTVYSFSGAEMNGSAQVKVEKLKLTDLQEENPDGTVSVYVLRYDAKAQKAEDKAQRVSAEVKVNRNSLSFTLDTTGLYDIVTVVRLPEKTEEPDDGEQGEPTDDEGEQGEPVDDEGEQGEPDDGEGEQGEPVDGEGEQEEPAEQPAKKLTEKSAQLRNTRDSSVSNTLTLGQNTVLVTDVFDTWYFTPSESGPYCFYSVGAYDPDAILLCSGKEIGADDNDGNFSIAADLTANTQYELRISDESAEEGPEEITVFIKTYEPVLAGYVLSPAEYTLSGSGFTDISCSFASLTLGDVNRSGQYVQAEDIAIYMKINGTLNDGNEHSIPFRVADQTHDIDDDPVAFGNYWPGSAGPFTVAVYIDQEDFDAAESGTYTGSLDYDSVWNDDSDEPIPGTPGSITLTLVVPEKETPWDTLGKAFNEGGEITLTDDVTAPDGASALMVPKGKTVTLNLNGHTIDRGLTGSSAIKDGNVITVNGTLIITGNGTITGGNTTGVGGGIKVKTGGSCTLSGGTINGNHSADNGGGVYVSGSNASFTLNGGMIANNTTDKNGGGIANVDTGTVSIQNGSITGNTASKNGGGVWFSQGYVPNTMSGGIITGNTAGMSGGGVYMNQGEFEVTGGSITGNTAPTGADIAQKDETSAILYGISIDSQITNGTVTATVENEAVEAASVGETMTLTVQPNPGYEVSSVKVNGEEIQPEDGIYSFIMPASLVTVTAQFRINWSGLQIAFNAGGTITLTHDITAGSNDNALTVSSGKTVTLDLNGHTLSRGLQSAAENGHVILNNGALTITDSVGSGTITGGNNTGNGGGINNTGTLTLAGGSISSNTAGESAGGVWNQSGAVFTMTGGIITGNTAVGWHGGGVYNGGTMNLKGGSITGNEAQGGLGSGQGGGVLNNGTLNVSGAPVVSGNTGPHGNNIYMRNDHRTMTVTAALTEGASLYVTSARGTDTITSGYDTYNNSAYPGNFFHADSADYGIALSGGEVQITTPWQITVETTVHGSVIPNKTSAFAGETVYLMVEPDEGYWLSSIALYKTDNTLIGNINPGTAAFTMPGYDTKVVAEFKEKKAVSAEVKYYTGGQYLYNVHGTLTANKVTAGGGETVTLTLTTDEGYGPSSNGVTVYANSGANQSTVTVSEHADGTWTFVMPDGDYTATAFAEIEWKNAPPTSGDRVYEQYLYIQGGITGGSISSSPSIAVINTAEWPETNSMTSQTGDAHEYTLSYQPAEGYTLKKWIVESSDGYTLPVEGNKLTVPISYKFGRRWRISAEFEQGPQPCTLRVEYFDKTNMYNPGSTISVDSTGPYYAGDEVTIHTDLMSGAAFSTYEVNNPYHAGTYPRIMYTSKTEDITGEYTRYIDAEPQADGSLTFTVPSDIDPQDPTIYILAMFEDVGYAVNMPDNWDEKVGKVTADVTEAAKGETVTLTATVAGNVTFVPATDLIVSYIDGDNQIQTVPVTLKSTQDLTARIYYTCEFTMPAYAVDISANFTQKAYSITRADISTITPAENRPSTTITVAGFDVSTDHVYARANENDEVALEVTVKNGYEGSKGAVRKIYYTLDNDPDETPYYLTVTLDEFQNPSTSFNMPTGDITLHYEIETAYAIVFNKEGVFGTFSADKRYAFQGETITVTGTPDNTIYPHDRLVCTVLSGSTEIEGVAIVKINDDTYTVTFTMPNGQAVVNPEFQMEPVTYKEYSYSEAGGLTCTEKTIAHYFTVASNTIELGDGDYVVKESTTISNYIAVKKGCTANLIVPEGVTLTCQKGLGCSYYNSGEYATLNLFGDGKIVATGKASAAGIGGANNDSNGKITIHIASVTATGGDKAAGIGDGEDGDETKDTSVIIYGGTITATGGRFGAGIGGGDGDIGTPIHIHGGTVMAYGGQDGAGIGGGRNSGTNGVYITGGTVKATGKSAAGIGGGYNGGNIREIHISGGNVTAIGGGGCAGIGGSMRANMKGTIRISGETTHVNAVGEDKGAGIGAGGYSGTAFSGGDMRGEIIIECGAGSRIEASTWGRGSGIGAGYGGNMTGSITIKSGNVYVNAGLLHGGGAGIGGGEESGKIGGEGGDVTINGGHVEIWGVGSDAECIGHGDNDSKSGSLKLADHLRVTVGGEPVNRSKRTDQCHSRNKGKTLVIEACPHDGFTYTVTKSGHTPVCAWCNAEFQEEAHHFNNSVCDVCGYEYGGTLFTVSFAPNGGSGEMKAVGVVPNSEYVLPECGFTPPAGEHFTGWLVSTDNNVYQAGETITVSAPATLTARWEDRYSVTFLPDLPEGEYEGEMETEYFAEGETFIVPESRYQATGDLGFVCWTYTGSDGTSGPLNVGDKVPMTTNLELTAQYGSLITVTLKPGYDESTEEPIESKAAIGSVICLPECSFTPPLGLRFKEWSVVIGEAEADIKAPGGTVTVTANTTATAVWEDAPTVIIKSANVEFQGVIRLQFTFNFPEDVLADEGAYLTFEKAGTTTTTLVSEGTVSGEDRKFIIPVPAPEYADDITIKAYDGKGNQLNLKSASGTDYTENGFVYSVKTYAQKMSQNGSTEQMRNLAKALDNYGTAAQIYFAYGDYSGLSVDSTVTAVTLEDLAPYALTTSGTKPSGVTGASIAVAFESDNTLRITFKTDGSKPMGDYTFLLDDVGTTPIQSGNNARLQVINIAAPNLDTPHTFAVSDGTDTYTVTASAMSYAYTSVRNGNTARQNLGKALYLYNQAANARFGN